MKPHLHVYTICWNEARLLPYFFRHYDRWAERIVVCDNGSDDGSCDLVRAQPRAELRFFDTHGESREDLEIEVKSHAWKEVRGKADWVIVCDVDELLHHPRLVDYLADCRARGVTIPVPTGYEMLSEDFPTTTGQIHDEVTRGFHEPRESKPVLFNPRALEEINYAPGAHEAAPLGTCVYENSPALKLLHFKFLGWDYLQGRYRELAARKSRFDREQGFGHHYFQSDEELAARYQSYRDRAAPVSLSED